MPRCKTEKWKSVKGYKSLYEVSSFGRVRSLDREVKTNKGSRKYKGKTLVAVPDKKSGYDIYGLSKGGKVKNFRAHVLVAVNFLKHKPCGFDVVVDHKDENPRNNHIDNLQLISHRDNISKSKSKIHKNKYTGVCWHKGAEKYISSIMVDKKLKHLGYFDNAEQANKERLDYVRKNL